MLTAELCNFENQKNLHGFLKNYKFPVSNMYLGTSKKICVSDVRRYGLINCTVLQNDQFTAQRPKDGVNLFEFSSNFDDFFLLK